jgi:hypothetical protein
MDVNEAWSQGAGASGRIMSRDRQPWQEILVTIDFLSVGIIDHRCLEYKIWWTFLPIA